VGDTLAWVDGEVEKRGNDLRRGVKFRIGMVGRVLVGGVQAVS